MGRCTVHRQQCAEKGKAPCSSTGRPRALLVAEASNPLGEQAAQWFCVRAALCLPASAAQEFAALVARLIIPRHMFTCWRAVAVAWVIRQIGPAGRHWGSSPRGFVSRQVGLCGRSVPSAGRCPRRVVDEVGPIGRSARSARPYPVGFCACDGVGFLGQSAQSVLLFHQVIAGRASVRSVWSLRSRPQGYWSVSAKSVWRSGRPRLSATCLQHQGMLQTLCLPCVTRAWLFGVAGQTSRCPVCAFFQVIEKPRAQILVSTFWRRRPPPPRTQGA